MKKRLLSGVMAVMMVASIMTGCGDAKKDVSANADSDKKVEAVATTESDEGVSEETTEQEVNKLPESTVSREEIQQFLNEKVHTYGYVTFEELTGRKTEEELKSEMDASTDLTFAENMKPLIEMYHNEHKWHIAACVVDGCDDELGYYCSDDGKILSEVEPCTKDVDSPDLYKDRTWETVDRNGEEWTKITITFKDDLEDNMFYERTWSGRTVELVISPKLDEVEFDGVHYTYIAK